jgi:hypothetical protein
VLDLEAGGIIPGEDLVLDSWKLAGTVRGTAVVER